MARFYPALEEKHRTFIAAQKIFFTATGTAVYLRGSITLTDLGTFARTGGSITLQGTLDAEGGTIDLTQGLFQDLRLDGGTLANATLIEGAQAALGLTTNASNTLSNVTVQGGLTLGQSQALTVTGGTTVAGPISVGSNSTLTFNGYDSLP